MTVDKATLAWLADNLPRLQFDPQQDMQWPATDAPQSYLDFYQINFAREFPAVRHGFGRVDVGDFKVAAHYWLPADAKGTVIVVHGYYDHVGIYRNPIRLALEQGFAVLAFDLPGHGLSSGMMAAIDSFDQYADVLAALLAKSESLLPGPRYTLGQSMGGAVLLNYCWRYSADDFEKIVLCAPLVLPRAWRSGRMLHRMLKGFVAQVPRRFSASSHNKEFIDFIANRDHLQSQFLSVAWVSAMKIWAEGFRHVTPLQKEVLIIQGTGDRTVEWPYNLELIKKKLPNALIKIVDDAGHHLINESPEYLDQITAYVRDYLFPESDGR